MELSCSCYYDWDGEGWCYCDNPEDFAPLPLKRSARCKSCGELIRPGEPCLSFQRMQYPQTEAQIEIYGGEDAEIMLAPDRICEDCGEIFLNLCSVGYECLSPRHKMADYLAQYHEKTGWKPGRGPGREAAA